MPPAVPMDNALPVLSEIDVVAEMEDGPAEVSVGVVTLTPPDWAVMEEKRKAVGRLTETLEPVRDVVPESVPVPVRDSAPAVLREIVEALTLPLTPLPVVAVPRLKPAASL